MASIQYKNKSATIQFTGPDKRRRTVRLRATNERDAARFADKLEQLNTAAKLGQSLDTELGTWVAKLGVDIAEKLAEYGLMPRREAVNLGPFLEGYAKIRNDVKAGTTTFYSHTQRNLLAFFGASRPLRDIYAGDADEFRLWLMKPEATDGAGGQGLSENTVRRRCTMAAQFFRAAMRKGIITSNPFDGIGGCVKSNKARVFYISREDAAKVDAACPDLEWRLIFALARFGGLRTPSEPRGLRWVDIDWARDRFLVHSPKTEHHQGGESRWVPIFPELRPLLTEAFEKAEPGTEYVIHRFRNQTNLRTRLGTIIRRAGLNPWPKLYQNLRSSRQTELAALYPLHIVCAWLGNKAAVAAEHYLQVTDADFANASRALPALHTGHNSTRLETIGRTGVVAGVAENCDESSPVVFASSPQVGDTGCELSSPNAGNAGDSEKSAVNLLHSAPSGATACQADSGTEPAAVAATSGEVITAHPASAAQLAVVVGAWPRLTEGQRAEVLKVVEGRAG